MEADIFQSYAWTRIIMPAKEDNAEKQHLSGDGKTVHASKWPIVCLMIFGWLAALLILVTGIFVATMYPRYQKERAAKIAFTHINDALLAYASEAPKGLMPPVAPYPDMWVPDLRSLIPDFLTDPSSLVSPYHPDAKKLRRELMMHLADDEPDWERIHRITAQSIVYTGYTLQLEGDLEILIKAGMPRGEEDIEFEGTTVYRFRLGVERFLMPDDYARINRRGHIRTEGLSWSPSVYLMEQPALADFRPRRGLLVPGVWGVEFIAEGFGFPVLPSVAATFPPPPME